MQIGQKKYNHLKILFIGKTRERIFNFFKKNNISYFHYNEFDEFITNYKSYNFLISYGCNKIFDRKVISYFKNSIINCHQSYLPWNRGADPNLWSFVDGTTKGVTIHKIEEKIDQGDILLRKKIKIDPQTHTFETSYELLLKHLDKLLINNFDYLIENKLKAIKQPNFGTFNFKDDKKKFKFDDKQLWKINIKEFLKKIKNV